MRRVLGLLVVLATTVSVQAQTQMWVGSDTLNRRTCPSISCGVVGKLFFREAATVLETKAGWGRVSRYYDASCSDGMSAYVDSGDKSCTPENGIVDGQFAEWVSLDFIVSDRPADPALGATGTAKLVGQSDDFQRYQAAFVKAAETLMSSGRCSAADFEEMGGWVKSSNHANQPIYFTYCGGMTIANRLYLNAQTGEVFR